MTVRHYLEMLRGALAVLCVGLLCLVVVFKTTIVEPEKKH